MAKRQRKWMRRLVIVAIGLMLAFCIVATFGVLSGDETTLRGFAEASNHWQVNTEFRTAAMEYCSMGSAATRARVLGFRASQIVMLIRSIPGLPEEYAADDGSQEHYNDFSEGPLSGYLHLCRKQNVEINISCVEAFGSNIRPVEGWNKVPSLAEMERFLKERKMGKTPVVHDSGAQQSALALFRDTEVFSDFKHPRLFKVRTNIAPLLAGAIGQIASELHVPTDPKQMTPEQQQWVLDRLDRYVRVHDPELWRTKQLSDFFGGLWAQVYGPDYGMLIVPAMMLHSVGRNLLVVLLALLTLLGAARLRRLTRMAAVTTALDPVEMTV